MKSKFMTVLTLVLAISMGTATFHSNNAHAYLLLAGASGMTPAEGPWGSGRNPTLLESVSIITLCFVLLPACVLDQHGSNDAAVSTTDLADNGYSAEQIVQIQSDQANLIKSLHDSHYILQILPSDTKASIQADIRNVYPTVSQTYLEFAAASAGLK